MLVDKRCKKGSNSDKVGCDLGYRSHKTPRSKKQVKCKGSMNFNSKEYKLDCKPDKTEDIFCKFSTSLDFKPKSKKHLTNRRYKKKRMAYLNCVQTLKSVKKSKSKSKSNPKQKDLNKQYELLLNQLYDYFKGKDKKLEKFLKNRKTKWNKSKKATESSIKSLLIRTEYQYIPKDFQNILKGGKYKSR